MGYFDVAGSPDTANEFDLKSFIFCFPSLSEILEKIKQAIDNAIDNQSIVVRVVTHDSGIYKAATLFKHEGIERVTYIDSENNNIKEYDYEIKALEYWLFDIEERVFKIFRLNDGKYELKALSHLVLCDGQDNIKYFPYAFSISCVDNQISDVLTNDEIDSLLSEVFGFREYPFSEVLDGKEYLREFDDINYAIVGRNLIMAFSDYLKKEKQYEYLPHIGVYFSDDNIVVPSSIIVNKSKIGEYYVSGAPELIIEISIQNVEKMNEGYKKELYEKYGVQEYWTVHPDNKTVCVYIMKNGRYVPRLYTENEVIHVNILEEVEIDLSQVFEDLFVGE
ncbi:MAG: Uma2 family endonuclease [Oscillospiraceae bacterium]|nr:Uma2 family endonuclease [Oscillospiraceae bacterium]